jgi:hypothetical protein
MCFLTLAQKDISYSFYHLKNKYVELKHRKRMQLKSSIAKLRDGFKRVKNFQMIWKRVFEVVKWKGRNGLTRKSFENIFSSEKLEFPFFKRERLLEIFFLSLFFYSPFFLFFFFYAPSLY